MQEHLPGLFSVVPIGVPASCEDLCAKGPGPCTGYQVTPCYNLRKTR